VSRWLLALSVPRAPSHLRDALRASGGRAIRPPRRGWRAEKRKTYGFRIRCRARRAPLGAPRTLEAHAISRRLIGAGPRFRRRCPASPATDRSQRGPAFGPRGSDPRVQGQTVVSQLLAGPRNGHGRSPDAARVPRCEPDPRAPRPTSLRQISLALADRRRPRRRRRMILLVLDEDRLEGLFRPEFRRADFSQAGGVPIEPRA
jgi:hypothetical protein